MIIGKKIIYYDQIDSTNDESKRLIKTGLLEGTVIIAKTQSQGRGKPGSSWFSAGGLGIYLSVIVKPFKNPNDLGSITLIGARAVVATIDKVAGLKAEIKVPNDVLLNGKKICGILVERVASGEVVIGIGLNVNQQQNNFPQELKEKATSLKIVTGQDYDLTKVIEILLLDLEVEYLAYLNKLC
ncbi:biotin--[acetyl-CoA-carboxylase] ligase [candidate division WOR-1 bacterium RIFOXYB2_FULL_42_35]|uniref:Biotin--[acetyl-CoA-carboxylase] ligase n=1 Tax=candidate division WOR-1 bacterium RIFOXYC2_FULL_41_25 TaxID=1802586 RepID=A0A1F4TMS6_UNCSA|nr:MAG: biotin--[acetyl-CoA-carboxylase] ligase [candidate division WOR-1 bacterium RIFOXYA2_FULL_41_14]OGC24323.1 MAG: biotin--[acetyl-CoA-carboxylase] ligase [candidate division WOR-1 bacterium RIFOXYB2_FULL_42_35]OGC34025.1 MAG: biotin--[acetyl-CoA-carboxylase] ligase [candidate division WOR-1 bacterium RIFOXYC2_FULL_41_25]OGC42340.1 MAG: biotin--[acetyl-CoA-carboxylase] ligase [candidate division WOR-1 bacterium RIFOXYD2_FULL_41_8]